MASCDAFELLEDGCSYEGLSDYYLKVLQTQLIAEWILLAFPSTEVSANAVLSRACGSGITNLNALSSQSLRTVRLQLLCDAAGGGGGGGGGDADAEAFIVCSNISDAAQIAAIEALVSDLKGASLWDSMDAIYPFVGGNASAHSCNLRDTSKYSITWAGGVTHDANGITGNGTTGYGDTGFSISASHNYALNSGSIGLYSRTSAFPLANYVMGATDAGISVFSAILFGPLLGSPTVTVGINQGPATNASATNFLGLSIASRTASNAVSAYSPNASASSSDPSISLLSESIYVLGLNRGGGPVIGGAINIAFAFIGGGLSAGQVSTLRTIINTFQTSLGRNV